MLTVGSLFSGVGLCDLGLSWAGFRHQFFCEIDPWCRAILKKHWPETPIFEDIKDLKGMALPKVDILCGGFPCQDVSSAGNGAGIKEGTRSGLWCEYARLINEIRPKYSIIENVRGLLSNGIEAVLADLASLGYNAEWEVLPAAAFGAPHHRERVFIVAYPRRDDSVRETGVLHPLQRILGEHQQHYGLLDWFGIRFDPKRRSSAWEVFGEPVVHRVDDGSAQGLDYPVNVPPVPYTMATEWKKRLKALGNGIIPHQSWAIGACILIKEGFKPLPIPSFSHNA